MKKIFWQVLFLFCAMAFLFIAGCEDDNNNNNSGKGEEITITFNPNYDGAESISPIKIKNNTAPIDNSGVTWPSVSRAGFNPARWKGLADNKYYTRSTKFTADTDLVAEWTKSVEPTPELVMGTATNPIIKGDAPDIAIVRVDDAYYMVSTTMFFMPVCPVMKSYDLVNWKIVSYVADTLETSDAFNLETDSTSGGIIGDYGRGQWASSIRYYFGKFYVCFANNTTRKTYFFSTSDPENEPWERWDVPTQFHDPTIVYDEENDRMFVMSGSGNISLREMDKDLRNIKSNGISKQIISSAQGNPNGTGDASLHEGAQAYFYNDYYYIFTISSAGGWFRQVVCHRSKDIEGPYESKLVLRKGLGNRGAGVAQGSIIETPEGEWWGYFFQDRDAIGRVPALVPMRWENDWPVFGDDKLVSDRMGDVPVEFSILLAQNFEQNIYVSDDFDSGTLPLAWQWNHNPDNSKWSLTENPGYLRITTGRTSRTIYNVRNVLTMRALEPSCTGTVALESTNMKDGDIAGLMAFGQNGGFVGIKQEGEDKSIVMYSVTYSSQSAGITETEREKVAFIGDRVYLRIKFTFRANTSNGPETAVFQYSLDDNTWTTIGTTVNVTFSTDPFFVGNRFGLFNYATKEAGGYVDFDYFHFEEQ